MKIAYFMRELCLVIPVNELQKFHLVDFIIKLGRLLESNQLQITETSDSPSFVDLSFFTFANVVEKQVALRQAISSIRSDINENNGRHWVPVYIAYTYAIGKRILLEDYSLFFADIEALFPGLLTNIDPAASGYDRYRRYVDVLSKECKLWFICNGKLPPLSEWMSGNYVYQVSKEWRSHVHETTHQLLKLLMQTAD